MTVVLVFMREAILEVKVEVRMVMTVVMAVMVVMVVSLRAWWCWQ